MPHMLTRSAATTTYHAVSRTMQYLQDIPPHPTKSLFILQFPTTHADIIESFRSYIKGMCASARASRKGGNTAPEPKVVAVIDSIVSNPGALLPWKEMVAICREQGVWSVVDAAHSIGQELDINLSDSKPDFWISVSTSRLHARLECSSFGHSLPSEEPSNTRIPTTELSQMVVC